MPFERKIELAALKPVFIYLCMYISSLHLIVALIAVKGGL